MQGKFSNFEIGVETAAIAMHSQRDGLNLELMFKGEAECKNLENLQLII